MLKATNLIPQRRLIVVSSIMLILMLALVFRFFYLQVYSHEIYKHKAEVNRIRAIPLPAPRGLILDRNGEIIVDNYPTYVLTVIPGEMVDKSENFRIINECSGIDTIQLNTNYKKYYRGHFLPSRLAKDLTFDQLSRIEEHKTELSGINYIQVPERYYSGSVNAAHLLGYLKEVDHVIKNDLKSSENYDYGDLVGWRGLEKKYEETLRGKKGMYFVEVDALAREIGQSADYPTKFPSPGQNLRTTISIDLQKMLETELDGKRAVALAALPLSGDIIAMVSKPDYPPNLFRGETKKVDWQEIISNPDKPLLNRVTNGLYPPGSTLKMITALSLIEKGKVNFRETVLCTGVYELGDREFKCWKETGHGVVNMEQAIIESCNIYFYQMVQRLTLDEWAMNCKEFGFGTQTDLHISYEAKGLVPTSSYMNKTYGRWGWATGHLLNISLGQGELVVTPLQMLQYINIFATKGKAAKLKLVSTEESQKFQFDKFSDTSWNYMEKFMHKVIVDARGTGKKANPKISGLTIAGKTGTAQNSHGEPHSWFVGYGKKDDVIVSVVILVENGGHGGETAAPIAKKIFNHVFMTDQMGKLSSLK